MFNFKVDNTLESLVVVDGVAYESERQASDAMYDVYQEICMDERESSNLDVTFGRQADEGVKAEMLRFAILLGHMTIVCDAELQPIFVREDERADRELEQANRHLQEMQSGR